MNSMHLHRLVRILCFAVGLCASSSLAGAKNLSDLWWNPADPGRGLVVIDHDTDLFVVWCTYGLQGPTWFVMPGGRLSADRRTFEGDLFQSYGWGPLAVFQFGTARIDFDPADLAPGSARLTLRYTTGAGIETRELVRQPFGDAAPDWGNDATDMWWDPHHPGWGLAAIQHGADLFAVMLTHDDYGFPVFYVSPTRVETGTEFARPVDHQFHGKVYYTNYSTNLGEDPFDIYGAPGPRVVRVHEAGFLTLHFVPAATSGPLATLHVGDAYQDIVPSTPLVRLPFGASK